MTLDDAQSEAKRRWGPTGYAMQLYGPIGDMWVRPTDVGYLSEPVDDGEEMIHSMGVGDTFDEAFLMANRVTHAASVLRRLRGERA